MGYRQPRSHPFAIVIALVLAVGVGVVAIVSVWANQELLGTGGWVSLSGELLESKDVRQRVATFLGDELVGGTEEALDAAGEGEVAEAVVPRLRERRVELAKRVMATPGFASIWREANRSAHRALLRAIDERGPGGGEGAVSVDLTPALRRVVELAGRDGLERELGVADLAARVEPGVARITVLEAREVDRARDGARVARHLTAPAVIVALALYALALALGRRRLSPTFLGIGLALAATGALALLLRAVAGHQIVDRLVAADADRPAAEAAWGVATSKVADLAGIAIGLGAVVVLLVGATAIFRAAADRRA